ncbi:MAGa3780 family membrane protein [Mycoplasma hafezii]|uniref:MAGa3780 family membrane protein n=1 Tax=Mycoplasma hafezii TaxID=525886 RepID=UPI003CF2AD5C
MKIIWRNFLNKYKEFNKKDWATFSIGIILVFCYISITFFEWHMVSIRAVEAYKKIEPAISSISDNNTDTNLVNLVYPNANRLFWGGSTYWFTFLSNVFMGVTLIFYPFAQRSRRAQKFYFASLVYIIVVAGAYWTGIAMVPSTFLDTYIDEKCKSIFMHLIAPILGLSTLVYERKRIAVSTASIWSYAIWPMGYLLLLIIPTYTFGYKFMQFGVVYKDGVAIPPTELARGIVIYQLVSFDYPLGYTGNIYWIKIFLNIVMCLLAFFTAPAIGFLLRKVLRIPNPGETVQKIYFVDPEIKYAKEEFIKANPKKSFFQLFKEADQQRKNDAFQKVMDEIEQLRLKENEKSDKNKHNNDKK